MGRRSVVARVALWVADRALEGIVQQVVLALIGGGSVAAIFGGLTKAPLWVAGGLGGLAFVATLLALISYAARIRSRPPVLVVDRTGPHADYEHYNTSVRRIRVHNPSPHSTVRNLRLQFESCKQQWIHPVLLQRMNHEDHPCALSPKADAYFDLAYWEQGSKYIGVGYTMKSLPLGTGNVIEANQLDLTLSITADDMEPMIRRFAAWVDPTATAFRAAAD